MAQIKEWRSRVDLIPRFVVIPDSTTTKQLLGGPTRIYISGAMSERSIYIHFHFGHY